MASFIQINLNGFRTHKTQLQVYLDDTKPDFVLLNETRVKSTHKITINGYKTAARQDRETRGGGGTAILMKNNLKSNIKDISIKLDYGGETSAIELEIASKKVALVTYYCPDNINLNPEEFTHYLDKYKDCIFMGDYNASHLFFGSEKTDPNGEHMFTIMETYDLAYLNDPNEPTHHVVKNGYTNLLDYAFCSANMKIGKARCYVGESVGSDHLPVHLSLNQKNKIMIHPPKKR